jgi:ribonuclease VapC
MAHRPSIVLDSSAVLAYLGDEPADKTVTDLSSNSHEYDVHLMMSVVNVGEVWYITAREISESEADAAVESLRKMGIEFVEAGCSLARMAGAFKAKHRMSYADCFAAALAKSRKAELITGDREFRLVESDVRVRWLEV